MKKRYDKAYQARSDEWRGSLAEAHAPIRNGCRYVLLVLGSPEYGSQIEHCLDTVVARGSLLPEPEGTPPSTQMLVGTYQGANVGVLHQGISPQAFGASYTNLALQSLRQSRVEVVIAVGEMSSLQKNIRVGELVIPNAAIRGDDIHAYLAPPDEPAVADPVVSAALRAEAATTGIPLHHGLCWSCGAGAGIFDPLLEEQALHFSRAGVLGNCLEAATAFLLGRRMELRLSSLWLVADSIFEPLPWTRPVLRQSWSSGWMTLVQTALRTFVRLETEEA